MYHNNYTGTSTVTTRPLSVLPPPPMPSGYHTHQRPKTRSSGGIHSSPSRPMSPGEQFNQMHVQEAWSRIISGNPTDEDLRVCHSL